MKQNTKRILSVLLCITLLFLSACVSSSNFPEIPEIPKSTADGENNPYSSLLENLPQRNFEGASFRIATDSTSILMPTNGSSVVGKEKYLRNKAIEEKYNIRLTLTEESGLPTIAERVRSEALAGTDYCDLVLLEATQFQVLAAGDALVNVHAVPFLDLKAEYFYQDALNSTTFGAKTYGLAGDLTLNPENIYAVFFNKSLLSESSLPDLYQMVHEHQWDFANFLLYAEEVYSLGRASGMRVYGFSSTEKTEDLIKIFWAATGERFLANEYGSRPQLIFNNDVTRTFIQQSRNLFFQSVAYLNNPSSSTETFRSGLTLFHIAPLSCAKEITGSGINWGVLPIPKLDINQRSYFSYMKNNFTLAGFSNGSPDLEKSGIITSALFAATQDLTQSLFEQTYLNLYLNGPEDVKMLSLIASSPYYDPVEFFGQINSSYTAATQTLLYRVVAAEGNFDSLYDQYTIMFNRYLDENFR